MSTLYRWQNKRRQASAEIAKPDTPRATLGSR